MMHDQDELKNVATNAIRDFVNGGATDIDHLEALIKRAARHYAEYMQPLPSAVGSYPPHIEKMINDHYDAPIIVKETT